MQGLRLVKMFVGKEHNRSMALKTILNPDAIYAKTIKRRIKANNGYCPSSMYKSPSEKCPCMDFREMNAPGFCACGLYQKIEDTPEE